MDRDQTYFESFLKPAHPTRFGTELVSIPRERTSLFKSNRDEEIDIGYKRGWMGQKMPLKRLDGFGWSNGKPTGTAFNALRNSIHRHDDSKLAKKWFLASYSDTSSVSWLQFDLDRHHENGMTPWEKSEIDHDFHEQVTAIREMAEEVGFDVVWTTSPGDIIGATWNEDTDRWEGGEHIQGMYAWIKLEKPVQVKKLRTYVAALKAYYGIECECSVDSRNRLVRLPGQRYVEVADPETVQIIHTAEKPAHTLAWFAEAWHVANPAKLKDLFGPAWSWKQKKQIAAAPRCSSSRGVKYVHVEGCSTDHALKEKNTFKAATDRRICSRIAIKYQGQPFYFDQAVEEAKLELFAVRPSNSKTCRNQGLLHATCKRWMDHYFSTFDSSRCRSSKRDKEDHKRFLFSGSIEKSFLLRLLKKHVHLSFRELSIVSSVFDKMQTWKGRVYCRVLYSLAGGKEQWLRLKKSLYCYLVILDEWATKKCRQWGWSQKVLDGVSSMQQASRDAALLLAGVEEVEGKKRVLAGATLEAMNNVSSDPTDQGVLPLLQKQYDESMNSRKNSGLTVIGRAKAASTGQVKTGHFEEATVRRVASPVKGESSGESTQDGQSADNSDVTLAWLVLQADCPGVGG